jgi:hypothetical protein
VKKRILIITILILILFRMPVYGFTDIKETDWFFNEVSLLESQGVISGYSDGTFKPYSNVSYGQALKMVMSMADKKVDPVGEYTHWAANFYYTAKKLNYIPSDVGLIMLDKPITRQAVANLIVKVLELDTEDIPVNLYTFKDTKDVSVNTLFSIGVINGFKEVDGLYFKPNNLITRAEISMILVRIQNYQVAKVKETIDPLLIELGLHSPLKKSEIDFSSQPFSIKEFEKVLVYMASSGVYEYTIEYPTKGFQELNTPQFKEMIYKAFKSVHSIYPEYYSFTNRLSYKTSGTNETSSITFNLINENFTSQEIKNMQKIFVEEVTNVVVNLFQEAKIRSEMTDREKARVLFNWVADNTSYDYSFESTSYTGYGQIVNKEAVCQGYTATYNYMCKLVGLDVQGISGFAGKDNQEHIWTLVNFDGVKVHIDTTWGDPDNTSEPNYFYFGATSEAMRKTHIWDSEVFGD